MTTDDTQQDLPKPAEVIPSSVASLNSLKNKLQELRSKSVHPISTQTTLAEKSGESNTIADISAESHVQASHSSPQPDANISHLSLASTASPVASLPVPSTPSAAAKPELTKSILSTLKTKGPPQRRLGGPARRVVLSKSDPDDIETPPPAVPAVVPDAEADAKLVDATSKENELPASDIKTTKPIVHQRLDEERENRVNRSLRTGAAVDCETLKTEDHARLSLGTIEEEVTGYCESTSHTKRQSEEGVQQDAAVKQTNQTVFSTTVPSCNSWLNEPTEHHTSFTQEAQTQLFTGTVNEQEDSEIIQINLKSVPSIHISSTTPSPQQEPESTVTRTEALSDGSQTQLFDPSDPAKDTYEDSSIIRVDFNRSSAQASFSKPSNTFSTQQQQQPSLLTTKAVSRSVSSAVAPVSSAASISHNPSNLSVTRSDPMLVSSAQPKRQVWSSQPSFAEAAPKVAPKPVAPVRPSMGEDKKVLYVNGVAYTKLEVVGQGGSSKVFKVMGPNYKIHALKRVAANDSMLFDSFCNEITLLRSLKGRDNIIQVIDAEVDMERQRIHIVMEFGDVDLAKLLHKMNGKKLNENYLRLYWQQMLEAVNTIHEERIIHGDLKPANFLLVEGVLKLIDFGIAKAISNDTMNIVRESQVGTLSYMAPESIGISPSQHSMSKQPLKLGRPSDIWSLGIILYQIVYGRTPFSHLQPMQRLLCIPDPNFKIEFPAIQDSALLDVMKRCLKRTPSERPTMAQLLDHPFLRPSTMLMSTPQSIQNPVLSESEVIMNKAQLCELFKGVFAIKQLNRRVNVDMFAEVVMQQLKSGEGLDIASLIPNHNQNSSQGVNPSSTQTATTAQTVSATVNNENVNAEDAKSSKRGVLMPISIPAVVSAQNNSINVSSNRPPGPPPAAALLQRRKQLVSVTQTPTPTPTPTTTPTNANKENVNQSTGRPDLGAILESKAKLNKVDMSAKKMWSSAQPMPSPEKPDMMYLLQKRMSVLRRAHTHDDEQTGELTGSWLS
eukprot:GILK01008796.1.p1 GENE.GILK01008796.1~~GILK01008796.1.p1  ORF type:complete len:1048 (+),score=210.74 GILK01008796.1:125-3145(+)